MSLEERINGDIKTAMLAKDKDKLNALRAIKSAILLLKSEKNAQQIDEDAELKTLQKLAKARKEAAQIYQTQNRKDLYDEEMAQYQVIAQYLPAQMSEVDIENTLKQLMTDNGIDNIKDMGKLMGLATKTFAGKADNKIVSQIVKRLLS
ncbi:MAG: GatB/YqeY domain-containing protein [Bacteroidales bacterium]|jgi:uncharacterized protein YqeY|nr:GatB/YqeY domain-containing protein [Bacteroidales bacterium]